MAGNRLSAKEAALIAQARAELEGKPAVQPGATAAAPVAPVSGQSAPVARAAMAPARAAIRAAAADRAAAARNLDPAEHAALLMATARAETERLRRRHKTFYLWIPAAVISATALWTLVWMWLKL